MTNEREKRIIELTEYAKTVCDFLNIKMPDIIYNYRNKKYASTTKRIYNYKISNSNNIKGKYFTDTRTLYIDLDKKKTYVIKGISARCYLLTTSYHRSFFLFYYHN